MNRTIFIRACDRALYVQAAQFATDNGISLSALIARALAYYLRQIIPPPD